MRKFILGLIVVMAIGAHCGANTDFGTGLIDMVFVSKKELFIYQRGGRENTTLSPPGWTSDVPPSVECYLADPKNWANSAEARSSGVSSDIKKVKILAVLPIGTRIRVRRFSEHHTWVGQLFMVYGTVENPRFSNREVRFFALFDGTGGGDFNLRPREEFLRAADE